MSETIMLTGRDRAVLRAVQAGRCQLGAGYVPVLRIDGFACTDSAVGYRLLAAGLIRLGDGAGVAPGTVTLTEAK